MPNRFFVTGTDTGIGKTVVSALLCAALDAAYWKPIQTGAADDSDRTTVMQLARLAQNRTIPEAYCFQPPVSPHLAAKRAGVRIDLRKISLPEAAATGALIVEGAGGVLVPINKHDFMVDLMKRLGLPVVLVSRSTLGTINHTLLSLAALRAAKLTVQGVVMVGKRNEENRKAIEEYGSVKVIGILTPLKQINRAVLIKAFRSHFDPRAFGL